MTEREIFTAALSREDPAGRAAFLDEACAGDAPLRQRVESLLTEHQRLGSFMNGPSLATHAIPQSGLDQVAPPTDPEATELFTATSVGPGVKIGPYKLLQPLGEGGMGVVYMAEQFHPVQRKVALKIIKPGLDSRQIIARFEAERQALAMMDHVHIARVLDAGTTAQGLPYFVMELVHGVPITRYCDDQRLTPRQRLELFVPVCQAIQHAHQKGIIHRDIKPSNVMVTLYDGKPVPKVIDFGVAKATEQKLTERTFFTQYGTMVGTLEYMSPEQAEMSALGVDTRSDIYSLGVLLYELLTGSTPLTRKRLKDAAYGEILRMIKEEEPPRPSTRLSDSGEALASISAQRHTEPARIAKLVSGELDWIVMKTLEKDRNRRYETANAFAADVLRYLNDEPVQACPPSAWYRFGKFARRNKGALAMVAVLLTAFLLGTSGLAVSNVLVRAERNQKHQALGEKVQALGEKQAALTQAQTNFVEARKQAGIARKQERIAIEQGLLARRRFYASQMNLAMQAWEAGQAARMLALLESQRPKVDEDDLRTFEWYYLWRLCQGGLRHRFPQVNYDNSAVLALSPDGLTLVTGFIADLKVWDARTGQEKGTLTGHHALVHQAAITSDGRTLISSDDVSIRTWDLATCTEKAVLTLGSRDGGVRFAVCGDSSTLVLGGPRGLTFWDWTTDQQVLVEGSGGTGPYHIVAVDTAGQRVAACDQDSTIRVWARDGVAWRERPCLHAQGWCPSLAFSPDGLMLATAWPQLKCYDPATGKLQFAPVGHTGDVISISFSANGKSMVSAAEDQTARVWDASTGRQLACLAHPAMIYGAVLSADGKVAATAGDGIRVWDTALPEESVILGRSIAVRAMALSSDGKTLATTGPDGTQLWNVPRRSAAASLPASHGIAFAPDGKTLATRNGKDIELWSMDGERQARFEGLADYDQRFRGQAFSPDGRTLIATFGTKAILWDLTTRQEKTSIELVANLSAVVFSPDGKHLAAGSQFGVVKLFDAATIHETATLQRYEFAGTWTSALAFSRDSTLLAAGNQKGHVQVWDIATGRLHAAIRGHVGTVAGLSFSPDGRTLATASYDRTVILWDVATGQERFTLKGHQGPVRAVEFTPDGNTLVTGSEDGTLRLWPAAVDAAARARKQELDADLPGTPAASNERGDAFWFYGRTDEAAIAYAEADARLQKLAVTFPDSSGLQLETIRNLLSRSLLLEETGRPQEAGPLRGRAQQLYRKLTPQNQQALIWAFHERGRKLFAIQNVRQAERTYSQLLELTPADEAALSSRSSAHSRLGKWDKVVAHCSRLIEQHPDEWQRWGARGRAYAELSQWEKAVADFSKALELNPDRADVLNERGRAYEKLGKEEESRADLARSSQLQKQAEPVTGAPSGTSQHYKEHLKRAEVLRQENKHAEAETALREAIRLNPGRPWTHQALGWTLMDREQFGEAEAAFQEAIRLEPENAGTHHGLGRALLKQKKSAGAIAPLRKAISLQPTNAQIHEYLGWALLDAQQFAEAEAEFREAARLKPAHVAVLVGLSRALKEQKKSAEAIATLRESIRLEPTNHGAHDALGWALVEQQDFSAAEAVFREQARLKPDLIGGHFGLGRTLVEQKKFAEAETVLREALRIAPEHVWVPQLLGRALAGRGKTEEAAALLSGQPEQKPQDGVKLEKSK